MALKAQKVKHLAQAAPSGGSDEAAGFVTPFERLLEFQAELFRTGEPGVIGWIERSGENAGAALNTLAKLACCRDLGEAAAIHADWVETSLKRLDREVQALLAHSQVVTQCATRAGRQAAEATGDFATAQNVWLVRKTEPAPANAAEEESAASRSEAAWQAR